MMFVERAAEKPSMLKLISVAVQSARPAITGNKERFTHNPAGEGRGRTDNGHNETSHQLLSGTT